MAGCFLYIILKDRCMIIEIISFRDKMGKTGKPGNRLKGFAEEWRKVKASPEIQALVSQ